MRSSIGVLVALTLVGAAPTSRSAPREATSLAASSIRAANHTMCLGFCAEPNDQVIVRTNQARKK
jgi:hypothetical protein